MKTFKYVIFIVSNLVYILPLRNENPIDRPLRSSKFSVYILPLRNENYMVFPYRSMAVMVYILPLRNENIARFKSVFHDNLSVYILPLRNENSKNSNRTCVSSGVFISYL